MDGFKLQRRVAWGAILWEPVLLIAKIGLTGGSQSLRLLDLAIADLLVSGIAREGHRLLAVNTFGDLVSTDSLSYQWLLDGQALAGATGKSLLLDAAHIGKAVSVSVSYRNAAGQTQSALSPAVPEVLATPAGQGVHLAVHLSQAAVDGMGTSTGGDSGLDRI
eukprot:gene31073-53318_t